jgi:hypothetical protein
MIFNRYRILAAYVFAIPLALILGFLAASPNELTFMLIGLLMFFLALPLFFKWHHALLIFFWNSAFAAFFLPGQPAFWLFFAALSFGISFLSRIMGQKKFLRAPEFTHALFFLIAVVLCTMWYRGGIGIRVLGGSTYGGKKYVLILGAVLGYFALTAVPIPIHKSAKMAGWYFISGTTSALSNLVYILGPTAYFVYYLVPANMAWDQILSDFGMTNIDRLSGLGGASIAALCFLLARYGIRGLLELKKPWRFAFLCLTITGSCFAGYRSAFMLLILIFAFQFYFEGLLRTRLFPVMVGLAFFGFVTVLLFANKMPPSVQRTISFLPVNVNPDILANARGSTDWRLDMWAVLVKDIPKYLIIGKGYVIDPVDIDAAAEDARMGIPTDDFGGSLAAGDYHSGPLSLIISFGLLGTIGFLWVLFAGFRVLHSNFRYGDERLRRINCVLLSLFLGNAVSYFFIFGAFDSQLYIFLGAVGFCVSLNGGVKRKPKQAPEGVHPALSRAFAIEAG